ncbi:SlyX family protein [Allorhizobium sp. BGMRC 0089]|uniref:SlyX family protein n=1 Tax=Allorhizobium sonneratiae TaxID=2934936 RepID=UPI002034A4A9|nr:SlyX family protein [Allorhizobium sonneratiae]MCM2291660.1 SlyX family protein [Allorhizobium sonneratiae]
MTNDDDRLIRLEETVAYQARTIEDLSDEIARQWRLIEESRLKIERLTERFLDMEERSREAIPVTKPPHY